MVAIDVDFDVFKELTVRRRTEQMTENEVLRELLQLKQAPVRARENPVRESGISWVTKGISFPHGTEFRATYKGRHYTGSTQNGALVVGGKRYSSPSAAAVEITGNAVNGWRFWECKLPGETRWKPLTGFRK
jgi:hypothetical protein